MNDIQLTKVSGNTFDWSFKDNDLENVIGYQQLISAITHTIFLKYGELEQIMYRDKGTNVHNYTGKACNEITAELIKNELEQQVEQIIGVENEDILIDHEEDMIFIKRIDVTTTNGGLLKIEV